MIRVAYLSSTNLGKQLGAWLHAQPDAMVAFSDKTGEKFARQKLIGTDYDLGVSFLYPYKIELAELVKPRLGWLNFHPGPLPMMRGRDLAYHAIIEGRTHFGASLHYMDENFDTGPLVQTHVFPIRPDSTAGDLVRESHETLERLAKFWLPLALQGERLPCTDQEGLCWTGKPVYYKKRDYVDSIAIGAAFEQEIRALMVAERGYYPRLAFEGRQYEVRKI